MTKARAREWLRAVNFMIDYYSRKNDNFEYVCRFCLITDHSCENCLWVVFGDTKGFPYCSGYADKFRVKIREGEFTHIYHLRKYRPKGWVTDSLKRLNRWKKKLNKIIGGK